MWHLILSLFLITSVALSVVEATSAQPRQAPSPDLKFSCPKQLSNSLCCSNDLQSNGAVKDCQESRYIIPNPESDNGYATSVDRCTTSQLNAGYDTPVCCKTSVRTFKFEKGAPIFIGVNCMDAEDVSVGLEKRQETTTKTASKTIPQQLDINKFTKLSPFDHRQDGETPTATLPERGLPTFHHIVNDVQAESAQTPTPLWRKARSMRKNSRRNLKRASKSKNSVANTIINDLNSASSRAIVRNTGSSKTRAVARSGMSGKPAVNKKEKRQVGGLTQTLTGLLSLSNGTVARRVARWAAAVRLG